MSSIRKHKRTRRVLMVDIGGGSVKVMVSGRREARSFETAANLRPQTMVEAVLHVARDWMFDVVSIGYPGLVKHGHPVADPPRLGGRGWRHFDYERAFARPVRIINDAALQALAAYRGRRMLYIGLGTGLGSTLISDDIMIPMELGWLRFDRETSLLQQLADVGPQSLGYSRWRKDVITEAGILKAAFDVNDVVLGGGNAPRVRPLPRNPQALKFAPIALARIRTCWKYSKPQRRDRGSRSRRMRRGGCWMFNNRPLLLHIRRVVGMELAVDWLPSSGSQKQ